VPEAARHVTVEGRVEHVPSDAAPVATLQAWQSFAAPLPHALLQHTPSVQKPDAHSASAVHEAPLAFGSW
jgi:hypothetical protein